MEPPRVDKSGKLNAKSGVVDIFHSSSDNSSEDSSDDDSFPETDPNFKYFQDSFTEAVDSDQTYEEKIENIVVVLTVEIEGEFEYFFDNFISTNIRLLPSIKFQPEFFNKERFSNRYTDSIYTVRRQLKRKIKFGVSYFPEHQQGDWLEQLRRVLDETSKSYREQTKVDALFESFKEVADTVNDRHEPINAGVRLQNPSFVPVAEPRKSEGANTVATSEQLDPVSNTPIGGKVIPPPALEALNSRRHKQDKKRDDFVTLRHIWNHFTISRDETSANDIAKELLYAILSPQVKFERGQKDDRFGSETATETLFQYQKNQPTKLDALDSQPDEAQQQRELSIQHNRSLLEAQKQRLQQTRQNMLLDAASRQAPTPKEQVMAESAAVVSMAREELESEASPASGKDGTIFHENGAIHQNTWEDDPGDSATEHQNLKHRIASLEQENKRLKTSQAMIPRCQVLFFIKNEGPGGLLRPPGANSPLSVAYLDEPTWSIGPNGEIVLRANFPIPDVNGFLRQRPDIAFVVSHYYSPMSQNNEVQDAARAKQVLPQPKPTSEILRLHSPDMIEAVENFLALQPKFSVEFPSLNIRGPLHAPYLFWYHYRSPTALDVLSQPRRDTMQLLTSWIEEHYAEKFDRVDDQLKRGVISEDTMPFLVKPGDVLVWKDVREVKAVVAKSWPTRKPPINGFQGRRSKEQEWTSDEGKSEKRKTIWTVDSWNFRYDGKFYRKEHRVEIVLSSDQAEDEVQIEELETYPLHYANPQFKIDLENRGSSFWRCRHQNLLSYEHIPGENQRDEQNNGERFMVDFETYRQLHSSSSAFKMSYPIIDEEEHQRMDADTMKSDKPPSAPDIYVFPNTIPGYNLRSKKWVDLKVDMIRDVTWNKKSFEHLVVDDETKELVQALVKHQIAGHKSTDIIDRKGNGLIILLHGGPGTGKTFTAESVAEMAEKPLFRITCGDIGTEPEKVENYLDSVLHLGKIWDCIVLIDEAEVFLEQRNLNNLERNALVSVFLRVLEYYEGILILTSNRVGTFDEAFKSRILLSLHYDNLGEGQRTKIWKNFFKRQKEMAEDVKDDISASLSSVTELGSRKRKRKSQGSTEGIDFDDVECYITDLAKHELNGRQIRNVITTARQLAVSRNELMRYRHLEHVIKVSSKFDNYLKTVREGFSDDQVARDEGIR